MSEVSDEAWHELEVAHNVGCNVQFDGRWWLPQRSEMNFDAETGMTEGTITLRETNGPH